MNQLFEDNDIVCRHLGLTKASIVKLIKEKGFVSLSEIQDETDAGTVCGTCIPGIEEILEEVLKQQGDDANR